jgi:hypothetical protein
VIWVYLFIAVLAQDGTAHVTYGVPFATLAACQEAKIRADLALGAETRTANPEGAAKYKTACVPIDFSDPASWAAPRHIPGRGEL